MGTRLGIIVPSGNTLLEPELSKLPIPGASFHFTRIVNYLDTEEELAAMIDQAPEAAELLSQANVKAIAFGCTGGSFLKGKDYDQEVIKKMEDRVSIPCTTTSTAAVKALKEMGIQRMILLTPYEKWLTDRGAEYFQAHGFDVIGSEYLSITDALKMVEMTPSQIADWAKSTSTPNCDGLFISCTCFPAMGAAEQIEKDLGIPVVTSNQATVWEMLKIAGYSSPISGYGTLLRGL